MPPRPASPRLRSGSSRTPLSAIVAAGLVLTAACAGAPSRPERRRAPDVSGPAGPDASGTGLVRRITRLKDGGGRLDWGRDAIAFDMLGPEGLFGVYVMRPDGTEARCLTCGHPDLPRRHIGQPAWHPSGRYLVFQAEKAEHARVRFTHALTPGGGVLNDLWVLDTQTNRATRIREI